MKKKNVVGVKIALIILITLVGILIINKERVNILEKNKQIIEKTTEVKEQLLTKKTNINTSKILGSVNEKGTGESIEDIEVILYKEENETKEKIEVTYTDKDGNYEFEEVATGTYKVEIDSDEYNLLNENEIEVTNDTLEEINMELEAKEEFKAEIKKYIKEIKINNNGKESIYTYDKENKVNIPIKNLKNLTGEVTYEFEVTNVKNKEGYVKVIKDTIPEGLAFDQDKNKDWKEKDGKLYTSQLSKTLIKSGETKKVVLILDIKNTDEAKSYLNKVSITGEVYHKLIYINLGEVYIEKEVLDGDIEEEETSPKREGYVFTGWYKDETLNEKFDFTEPITEDTKIYAGYKKEINVKYVIGEEIYKEEKIEEKNKTKKPDPDPVKEGYVFKGWYADKELTEEYDFDKELIEDTIIYGKFEENIFTSKVIYNIKKEDKWEVIDEIEIKRGNYAENKIGPEKQNEEINQRIISYQFEKWYKNEELTEEYDFNVPVTEDEINLYGKYVEIESCKTRENAKIPTKEEITQNVESNYNEVVYTEVENQVDEDGNEYIISNGFKFRYYDDTKMSLQIVDYINTNVPDEIKIPDSINGIPVVSIFRGFDDKKLKNVKISKTLKYIEGSSFSNSTIENIDFSYAIGLIEIKDNSFNGVTIEKLDLSNSINLLSIGENVFSNSNIYTFNFSNTLSLTTIGSNSFKGAEISNLNFGYSINLSNIKEAFMDSKLNIGLLDMTNLYSLENLTGDEFNRAGAIRKVVLSSSIKTIGNNSFANSNIEEVDFECANNLVDLGFTSFSYNNIKSVKLIGLNNISNIGSHTFAYNSLEEVVLKDLPSLYELNVWHSTDSGEDGFNLIIDNVPISEIENFISLRNASDASISKVELENLENLEVIGDSEFRNTGVKEVNFINLPKLTTIGNGSFAQNNITTSLIFDEKNVPSLKKIESNAFLWNNINKIVLKNLGNLEYIGPRAFETVDQIIDEVNLENLSNLTTIDDRAFYGYNNSKLEIADLPLLESIGEYAFRSSSNLKEIIFRNLPSLDATKTFGIGNIIGSNINHLEKIEFDNLLKLQHLLDPFISNEIVEGRKKVDKLIIRNCENIILDGTNSANHYGIEELLLENLPNVESIGGFSNNNIENLDLSKLTNLKVIKSGAFNNSNIKNLNLSGLNLEEIGSGSFTDNSLESIDLSNTNINKISAGMFSNNKNLKNINFNNSSIITIESGAFTDMSISELDLGSVKNLTTLGSGSFYGNPLKKIRLPESLTSIGGNALYSKEEIECVEILGDNTRFNDIWTTIGLPDTLSPGACVISSNTSESLSLSNVLGNIFKVTDNNIEEVKKYNIILYKMDDSALIDDEKTYKLQKLIETDYKDINLLEDYENIGRYKVDETANDLIKSFKNKIYINDIEEGVYRLINTQDNNETLTFIIESNSVLTGNIKLNNDNSTNKIMSESEAEFLTSIQTGYFKSKILLILVLLIFGIYILFKMNKIKNFNNS